MVKEFLMMWEDVHDVTWKKHGQTVYNYHANYIFFSTTEKKYSS